VLRANRDRKGMKKSYLIVIVALIIGGSFFLWVHSIRRPYQATFSDSYIISGDGAGPYTTVYADVQTGGNLLVSSENSRPLRPFSVKFGNASWLDRGLFPMPPMLNSTDYYLSLMVGLLGHHWSEVASMRIGEHFETFEIMIDFHDLLDYEYLGALYRYPSPGGNMPLPPKLLEEGHAYMVREGEDRWVLDVDAWFLTMRGFRGRTNYVRLTFRMAIDFRPIII
jgi:hypothetical protein